MGKRRVHKKGPRLMVTALAALAGAVLLLGGCAAGRLDGEGAGRIKVEFFSGRAPAASITQAALGAPGLGHIGRGHHQGRQD